MVATEYKTYYQIRSEIRDKTGVIESNLIDYCYDDEEEAKRLARGFALQKEDDEEIVIEAWDTDDPEQMGDPVKYLEYEEA